MFRTGQPVGRAVWWDERGTQVRTEEYRDGRVVRTVKYIAGRAQIERH